MTKKPARLSFILFAAFIFISFILPNQAQAQEQVSTEMVTIGVLASNWQPFSDEMAQLGYIDGENIRYITFQYDMGENFENYNPELIAVEWQKQAQTMINLPVDILVVDNDSEAARLRALAPNIPIVFTISDDPVVTGAVSDLTTPGGNATGVVSNQHHPRRLQLLLEVNPDTKKVLYLYSTTTLEAVPIFEQVRALGETLGVEVIGAPVSDVPSGVAALEAAPEDIDWLFITPYVPSFDFVFAQALFETSMKLQAPIANYIGSASPGNLISYGPDLLVSARQAARIVDRILRGASPSELSILIAENTLVVNLEAAAMLQMEVPVGVLRQAALIVRPGDEGTFAAWGFDPLAPPPAAE